jgi:hypothetical protein
MAAGPADHQRMKSTSCFAPILPFSGPRRSSVLAALRCSPLSSPRLSPVLASLRFLPPSVRALLRSLPSPVPTVPVRPFLFIYTYQEHPISLPNHSPLFSTVLGVLNLFFLVFSTGHPPPPIGPSFEAISDPSIRSLGARGRRWPRPRCRPHRPGAGWPGLPCHIGDFPDPKSSADSSAGSSANSCRC